MSAAAELVLLHSPLVGPSFWRPVARVLEERGFRCALPTARGSNAEIAAWRDWPSTASATLSAERDAIVVGHSAAGFLLPALAQRLGARGLIFVDALIPPASGSVPPASPAFLDFVRSLPIESGLLPPWSRWWKGGVVELLGDAEGYARFERELPRLPITWFDDTIEVPSWSHLAAGYVQTSERFAQSADDAKQRGWPVRVLAGTHLHPMVAAQDTAAALLEVIASLARGNSQR